MPGLWFARLTWHRQPNCKSQNLRVPACFDHRMAVLHRDRGAEGTSLFGLRTWP